MHWRLLLSDPLDGTGNMALDEALLTRARGRDEYVMRVYGWVAPTLSLGRNQRAVGVFDSATATRRNVVIVRRLTGGRAVLHHREVTYSVTGPAARSDTLRASYAAINQILLTALEQLGVPASLAPSVQPGARFPAPASAPCFELPAPGEIVLGNSKLVGSAQLRDDAAFLQHGSILIDDDQWRVAELTDAPMPAAAPAATLRAALGRAPSLREVAEALFQAVRVHAEAPPTPLEVEDDLQRVMSAARERYRSDSWTWRR
ncbi:MAG: lipoate--protein ligase family protein [Gemmatimonadaceae bacterium]